MTTVVRICPKCFGVSTNQCEIDDYIKLMSAKETEKPTANILPKMNSYLKSFILNGYCKSCYDLMADNTLTV